jgi:hypothetical protein
VLYALVSGGFLVVVAVLIAGAAVAGLPPLWWTLSMSALLVAVAAWSGLNWRSTGRVLMFSIGLFIFWTVGTLVIV